MAFEYVVVKEEFDLKEDANTEVLPAEEQNEAECVKKNIKLELDIPNNLSIKKEVEDPPPSPDSSQADHGLWHVPVKQEVEDVHPENFLQVDIGVEQWSEKDDELLKGHASGDSAGPPDSSNEAELDNKTSPGNFVCDICKKSFVNSGNLKRHLQLHSKKSFKCQQCDKSFLNEMRLNSHIYNRHTDKSERVFNCDECPKTFKTSSNLQQHKKTHLVHKPFECTKCSQTFAFKINYLKHQKKPCPITPPKKPIVCTICNKVFEKEFLLKSHLRRHDNDRPFGCEECTMVFKHKSTLMRHMHVHTGVRPYPCPYCDKTFTSSGLLKPHLRVHTGEKPYKCEVCPKTFAHKHNMQRHMVGHEKIKHTVCDICHKEFPRESRLRYHMKTHVNEKFFLCKVCPKRFSHKQNVIRHYARKHPGKTYSCEETDASVAAKVWDTVKNRLNDDEAEEILGLD